ncbi:MAG: LysR family transcriptional regulator, partial [Oscillospiraceae bacterium]
MLDIKLYSLLKVSETGSFTKAAQFLSLTQPAVSQHIKQLEQELGAKLFNRAGSGLRLTKEGEIAVTYARRISTLYQNMHQSLADEQRRLTRITIGITHTSESSVVAEVLAKYGYENEGLHITIISDTISNLYSKLRAYEVDLAIVEGKVTDTSLNSILLDTDCLVLAVSNNNPLAKKSSVTVCELKKEKMIVRLPDSGTLNLFISSLESQNLSIDEFNVILEVNNIATIKDLIRRDFGVSILARSACLDEL